MTNQKFQPNRYYVLYAHANKETGEAEHMWCDDKSGYATWEEAVEAWQSCGHDNAFIVQNVPLRLVPGEYDNLGQKQFVEVS